MPKDTMFFYDTSNPLSIGRNEGTRANKALNDYYLMGDTRSLDKLIAHYARNDKPTVNHVQTLKNWSSKFEWQRRVKEHDTIVNERVLLARQESLIKFANEYEDRAMVTVRRLLDRADEILAAPLDTANWSIDTAARLVATADKIARLTAKKETEITQVNVTDIDSIRDKLLARIAKEARE